MNKRKYITPEIEEIGLDNEISLQLTSPTIKKSYEDDYATSAPDDRTTDCYSYENW